MLCWAHCGSAWNMLTYANETQICQTMPLSLINCGEERKWTDIWSHLPLQHREWLRSLCQVNGHWQMLGSGPSSLILALEGVLVEFSTCLKPDIEVCMQLPLCLRCSVASCKVCHCRCKFGIFFGLHGRQARSTQHPSVHPARWTSAEKPFSCGFSLLAGETSSCLLWRQLFCLFLSLLFKSVFCFAAEAADVLIIFQRNALAPRLP